MKKVILSATVLALAFSINAQTKKTTTTKSSTTKTTTPAAGALIKTYNDSLSYAFGVSLGQYMKSQGVSSINYPVMVKAISQSLKGETLLMDLNQCNQMMGHLAEQKSHQAAAAEKEKGMQFLAENKKKAGVKVTPSGLQYEILKAGTGPIPTREDTVSAHYAGTLINGKEFDNSYKRGEPLTIPVKGVIPGWTEALTMMPVGSKWKLYIPSELGYGDYGAGQDIPGGAALIFEVELLDIVNKKQ